MGGKGPPTRGNSPYKPGVAADTVYNNLAELNARNSKANGADPARVNVSQTKTTKSTKPSGTGLGAVKPSATTKEISPEAAGASPPSGIGLAPPLLQEDPARAAGRLTPGGIASSAVITG